MVVPFGFAAAYARGYIQVETGAAQSAVSDFDMPAMFLDYAVDNGQAEAGSGADRFSREKGFKEFLSDLLRYAGAAVFDPEDRTVVLHFP